MVWRALIGFTSLLACMAPLKKGNNYEEAIVIARKSGSYAAFRLKEQDYSALQTEAPVLVYPILRVAEVSGPEELFNLSYRGTELGYHLFINMEQAKEIFPATYTAVALAAKGLQSL